MMSWVFSDYGVHVTSPNGETVLWSWELWNFLWEE